MTLTDWILAVLAFLCFVGFLAVVGGFVLEPNLIVVLLIGVGMAAYDFWRSGRNGA